MKKTPYPTYSLRALGFVLGAISLGATIGCGGADDPAVEPSEQFIDAVRELDVTHPATTPVVPSDDMGDDVTPVDETVPGDDGTTIFGRWVGYASKGDGPSYKIELTIYEDGVYEAVCPWFGESGPGLCADDGRDTLLSYDLTTIAADGSTSGRIEVVGREHWSFVSDLWLSEDGQKLRFNVWNPWNGEEVAPTVHRFNRL